MEKQIVKMLNLNCTWYADDKDSSGSKSNGWLGNVILYDDNSIKGIAYDNGSSKATHALLGFYVEDYGLSVYKLNLTNFRYDPIAFTVLKSAIGKENTYYGDFSAITPFSDYGLGYASINVKEIEKERDIQEVIENKLEEYAKRVSESDRFQFSVFYNVSNADPIQVSSNIKYYSQINYNKLLPSVFEEENNSAKAKLIAEVENKKSEEDGDDENIPF